MIFNPDRTGLEKVLRPREEQLLRSLWAGSKSTNELVKETGLRRDDVHRILGDLRESGVVDVREDYTMGPLRDVWSAVYDEPDFRRQIVRQVVRSMLDDWPEAREVLKEEVQTLIKEAKGPGP